MEGSIIQGFCVFVVNFFLFFGVFIYLFIFLKCCLDLVLRPAQRLVSSSSWAADYIHSSATSLMGVLMLQGCIGTHPNHCRAWCKKTKSHLYSLEPVRLFNSANPWRSSWNPAKPTQVTMQKLPRRAPACCFLVPCCIPLCGPTWKPFLVQNSK